MNGFKNTPIRSEWVQKAFGETDNNQAITDLAFSQTDEDDDSTTPFGVFTVHDTSDWRVTKGQHN